MANSEDNLKLFNQYCTPNHHLLESAGPMIDIAFFTIMHIKRLFITHASIKTKADLFKIVSDNSKSKGNLAVFYIIPITMCHLSLIDDGKFNAENFMALQLSMSWSVDATASLLVTGVQGTWLTNNLSKRTKQQVLSCPLQQVNLLSRTQQ